MVRDAKQIHKRQHAQHWQLSTESHGDTTQNSEIYVGHAYRNWTCEIVSQRVCTACSWWWRWVAGTLSLILTLAASHHVKQSSSYTHLNECLFSTLGEFFAIFYFYGDFSGIATGLWRGLSEPYAMSRVVPTFQIEQNVHRRRPQIWMAFQVSGQPSRWESACCDLSKSSPNCPWRCWRSRNL